MNDNLYNEINEDDWKVNVIVEGNWGPPIERIFCIHYISNLNLEKEMGIFIKEEIITKKKKSNNLKVKKKAVGPKESKKLSDIKNTVDNATKKLFSKEKNKENDITELIDDLRELNKLKQEGILTEKEFKEQKKKILK